MVIMSHKLYVGNIPYTLTEEDLNKIFSLIGEVFSVKIVTDRSDGRSKGFGFVEMGDSNLALEAARTLNGHDISGRKLRVDISKPRAAYA